MAAHGQTRTDREVSESSLRRQANPEKMLLANAKRRAKRYGVPFSITVDDVSIPYRCPVLGIKLYSNWGANHPTDNSPSLDRIVPELGYVPGNVVVISMRANRIKADANIGELQDVATYFRGRVNSPRFLER